MNCRSLRCLRGPNVWAACPVIETVLALGGAASWPAEHIRHTLARLPADLAVPAEKGEAEAFNLVALKLQELAGTPVSFAAIRPTAEPGVFRTAVEFVEEPVGLAAVEIALRHLQAAGEGCTLPLDDDLRRLRDLAYQQRLPASTAVIYHAARKRGIPAVRLSPEYGRFLRLGQGAKQHRCQASEPDTIGAVARTASTDKYLAKQLLAAAGVPVPVGRLVSSVEEAWSAAEELGLPVAIKPQDSDLAIGVSLDVRSREQVEAAFRSANEHSTWVLVERFAPGIEHRVLVVADRISAVTRIDPPHVIGDGVATVAQLVERVNRDPRRGDEGSGAPLSKLKIDGVAHAVLAAQGHSLTSVPRVGERVLVRRNPPYFKNGGNLVDLTDRIHPTVAAHAIAAAQALQLRVAGLDVVALDIGKPLEEQGGVVVEINAGPGLWLHLAPWADAPRPVGDDIVASMFPPGDEGRIPVVALVGDVGGGAREHLTALLAMAGLRIGVVGNQGIVVGERHWSPPVQTPQERVHVLMQYPAVDVALVETSPEELIAHGFGNDRCDVAIVLEPAAGEFLRALENARGSKGVLLLPEEGQSALRAALAAARVLGLNADVLQDYLRSQT